MSALACGVSTCVSANTCKSSGTCSTEGLCSFTNLVSLSTVSSYDASATSMSLASMLRGVCAPGERLSSLSNVATCVPFFPFPNAYNIEIEDASANSVHMKACGAWIDAGGPSITQTSVEYRSHQDHASWQTALEQAENASTYSPRTARGQMGKFRTECMRTALEGMHGALKPSKFIYSTHTPCVLLDSRFVALCPDEQVRTPFTLLASWPTNI